MLGAIGSAFAVALIAPLVHRMAGRASGWILALLPLGLFVYFGSLAPAIWAGEVVKSATEWAPSLGLALTFRIDGLGLLFALLITGIGTPVVFYSGGYLAGHPQIGRYYLALLLFMGSMLGVVAADNLILLFVFWELTSLTSYLLIGFDHSREAARRGALQALLVTGFGGLALLAGFLVTGQMAGTLELSELLERGDAVRSHGLYPVALALILLGAFTKSAQFPFHFWLPNAMEAPTPASAYLHAATMVKAGVYLLARLTPVFGGTEPWLWTVTLVGGVTMLAGAWLALFKSDLKQILAYSTVSVLGVLTFLLGFGGESAWMAMPAYLLAHGLYKGALFLVAGAVDHESGTRDIERLGGLRRAMPMTALAAALAALSMAGLPPVFGFIGKEMIYEAALSGPSRALLTASIVITGVLLFAVSGLVALRPFFGARGDPPKAPHEAPPSLWLGASLLAAGGLLFGLAPGLMNATVEAAAGAIAGTPAPHAHLALFHGFGAALWLSVATVAAGICLYAGHRRLRDAKALDVLGRWGPARWYEEALDGLGVVASAQTRLLQSGYLRYYLLTIILTTVGFVGSALARYLPFPAQVRLGDIHLHEAMLAGAILVSIVVAVRSNSRLTSVAALGVVGIGVALIFALFSAPDLAMTQFVIETLTVILLVLVLYHLPDSAIDTRGAGRVRDAAVAIAAGGMMSILVAVSAAQKHPDSVSRYFVENSVPLAHGRNVVNVILTDFRELDTLGEITVLAVAAVGVYSLLRLRQREERP